MRKHIILSILTISLFCSSLFASETTSYIISAYKQTSQNAGTYSMNIYDTLHGSLELLGSSTSYQHSNIELTDILPQFFYNDGDGKKIDDFNEHLLFAVLSFGTTSVPKASWGYPNTTNGTATVTLKVDVTAFKNTKESSYIPIYLEYNNVEFILLSAPNSVSRNTPTKTANSTATQNQNASFTQTITLSNSSTSGAVNASWEGTIAFAMGINRSDYNNAPLGEYISTVTVTLEAP